MGEEKESKSADKHNAVIRSLGPEWLLLLSSPDERTLPPLVVLPNSIITHAPNVTASSHSSSAKDIPLSALSELRIATSASFATCAVYPALLPHRPLRRYR
jgi:hypothetical protein